LLLAEMAHCAELPMSVDGSGGHRHGFAR
jgi:hypothetical protein